MPVLFCLYLVSKLYLQFFLAPPEKCELPRWYSSSYQIIYDSLVKLVPKFPPNLHLLPVYTTDFTMFEKVRFVFAIFTSFGFVYLCVVSISIWFFFFFFFVRWASFQASLWQGLCRLPLCQLRPVDGRAGEVGPGTFFVAAEHCYGHARADRSN